MRLFPLLVAIPGLFLGATVLADSDGRHELELMVVTAARVPVANDRTNQSMTVITRETIEQRQVTHVADLLRDVPGLSVSRSGGVGAQTQVRVRGAEANHLLVMIDGVEANDPASGDEFRFEHLLSADIERIEIVRGPQSALWGTDALAGVINIITRSGGGSDMGSAFVEGGSHHTFNGGANVAFGTEETRAYLGVTRFDTDGTNIARVGKEPDGADANTLTGRLQTRMSERARFDAMLRYVEAGSAIDTIDFAGTGLPADADLRSETTRLYSRFAGTFDTLGGRIVHSAALTYLDTDNDNIARSAQTSSQAGDKLGIRYQADFLWVEEHRFSAALEREETDFSQRGVASPFGDPNQDQSIDTSGLVLEYVGRHGATWDWSLGWRRDWHSDFEDANHYRAAIGMAISGQGRLRAAIGTGRKAPTFIERFGFFADTFVGNPSLKPERSKSFEFGYEHRFGDGSLGIVLFDQDLSDEVNGFAFDPNLGIFSAINELGQSQRSGVEAVANWRIDNRWSVAGNYTYTDATEPVGGARQDEVRRPRHSGHATLNYQSADARTNANLNIGYHGARTDVYFPPFPESSRRVDLDRFVLVDLAVRRDLNDHISLFARIDNLFDEAYEEVFGYATPGRVAMAGLRYRFGG